MLKGDIIWPNSRRFKSGTDWEPIGFFSEGFCNATRLDMMLGFFSSSAISVLSDGFAVFLYNGGKMRLIINDILTVQDKEAIQKGLKPLDPGDFFDITDIKQIKNTLSKQDTHFFNCLSWLIASNKLEIKIAAPASGDGISHTKCGVFYDEQNKVGFDGSCNFSRTALVENIESITAACDWDGIVAQSCIDDIENDFNNTFNGFNSSVKIIDAENVKTQIVNTFPPKDIKEILLESDELTTHKISSSILKDSIKRSLSKARKLIGEIINANGKSTEYNYEVIYPSFPYESGPRDYQKQAFEAWKGNGQKGLFAMATGTGKTITSLNCLLEIYRRKRYYKAIILVPTITLVNQWELECKKFNFTRITKVYSNNPTWKDDVDRIRFDEMHSGNEETSFIIISTYASFSKESIFKRLIDFSKSKVLLIADEAHNMGSPNILKILKDIPYLRRIGLSATPERQFDNRANNKVFSFFGAEEKFTFEYSMKDAIENGALCRYYYYPHVVELTTDEMEKYAELSVKISKYFNFNSGVFDKKDEILTSLLLARKRIIHKASNKLDIFTNIIQEYFNEKGNLKYTLVYVPEGTKPDEFEAYDTTDESTDDIETDKLIDLYTAKVSSLNDRITVRKFISGSKDREKILSDFASGKIQVLTSMKCLDEGVDVPRSELAIFCASTGNPRQFIQRRGRVLRTHKDKQYAIIHDLVVVPKVSAASTSYKMEQSLLSKELKRVADFASLSENPSASQMELLNVMNFYGLNLFNNSHIK